jgi:hypothetical protein
MALLSPAPRRPRCEAVTSPTALAEEDEALLTPLPMAFSFPVLPALPQAAEDSDKLDPMPQSGDFNSSGAWSRAMDAFKRRQFKKRARDDRDGHGRTDCHTRDSCETSTDEVEIVAPKATRTKLVSATTTATDQDFAAACEASRVQGLREEVRRAERAERNRIEAHAEAARMVSGSGYAGAFSPISVNAPPPQQQQQHQLQSQSPLSQPFVPYWERNTRPAEPPLPLLSSPPPPPRQPPVTTPAKESPPPHPMQRLANMLKSEGIQSSLLSSSAPLRSDAAVKHS